MATFKAVIYSHHRKEDGTYNVKIRVTQNRKKKHIATEIFVTDEDLTRKLKIKNTDIEDEINELIKSYRNACKILGERIKSLTVDQVVEHIQKSLDNTVFDLDFISYGYKKIEELEKEGRSGSAKNYKTTLNSLIRFVGREKISISEITSKFLRDYENWLKNSESPTKRKIGTRAVSLYTGYIRSLYNMAKSDHNDEDLGVIRIPFSPFRKYSVPKQAKTRKRALSVEKLLEILYFPDTGVKRIDFARDMFKLSFFLIGMNSADLFICDKLEAGRIIYKRAKTKDRREDEAEISIKIESEAVSLFEKYKDQSRLRVFSFHKNYSTKDTFNTAINKGLKKIGEKLGIEDLEFYAARHTWATLAINNVGIDKYTVHTALNHIDESMRITDIYISKDWSLIDKANRMVLDYLNTFPLPVSNHSGETP